MMRTWMAVTMLRASAGRLNETECPRKTVAVMVQPHKAPQLCGLPFACHVKALHGPQVT
jgi:hypothetical protein